MRVAAVALGIVLLAVCLLWTLQYFTRGPRTRR
jgi:hypothetical protein